MHQVTESTSTDVYSFTSVSLSNQTSFAVLLLALSKNILYTDKAKAVSFSSF